MSREYQIKHNINRLMPRRQVRTSPFGNSNGTNDNDSNSMQVKSEDEVEKKFWQKYYFEKVIGKGGYGLVLRIKNKTTNQYAACKIIEREKVSSDIYEALKEEPKFLNKLSNSKYIVHLIDSFESKKRLFIVMEYMKGGDLSHYIKGRTNNNGTFRESEVASIISCLLKGLKSIHGSNIIHGDIKPGILCSSRKYTLI